MIKIYTDGSSSKNGKPECFAGWAMCAVIGEKKFIRYGYLPPPSSNNKGEIMGVLYGMLMFHKSSLELAFLSDSQYVVKSINEWRHAHKKTRYDGIKNADLLVPLYDMWDEHDKSRIGWVKGHNGDPGNELADYWAGKGKIQSVQSCKDAYMDLEYVTHTQIEQLLAKRIS